MLNVNRSRSHIVRSQRCCSTGNAAIRRRDNDFGSHLAQHLPKGTDPIAGLLAAVDQLALYDGGQIFTSMMLIYNRSKVFTERLAKKSPLITAQPCVEKSGRSYVTRQKMA